MTQYDFDNVINRCTTASDKWDRYKNSNIIPLWVADMDFRSPPELIEALHQRVDHGIFGYTHAPESLIEALQQHLLHHYQWQVDPDWLVWLPGLVCGINLSIRTVVPQGAAYISAKPVYPPFMTAAHLGKRQLITTEFAWDGKRWRLDFERMSAQLTADTHLFMLCNPHNPLGLVWSEEDLNELAEFCLQHNLTVCADEIHSDLILNPNCSHRPYASINEAAQNNSITLVAPSKTWNIAGLGCSIAIIPNPKLRREFCLTRSGIVPGVNVLGFTAAEAAYRYGEPWRLQLIDYLKGNRDLLLERLNRLPGIYMHPVDATYLAWINVADLNQDNPPRFFEQAGVGMSPGIDFGDRHYMRLNFGCPRATLEQAVTRIEQAITQL